MQVFLQAPGFNWKLILMGVLFAFRDWTLGEPMCKYGLYSSQIRTQMRRNKESPSIAVTIKKSWYRTESHMQMNAQAHDFAFIKTSHLSSVRKYLQLHRTMQRPPNAFITHKKSTWTCTTDTMTLERNLSAGLSHMKIVRSLRLFQRFSISEDCG